MTRRRTFGLALALTAALLGVDVGVGPPSVAAVCSTSTNLREGMQAPEVLCLETLLSNNGYSPGDVDGHFGAVTRDAVIAYQRDHGLVVDGWVGRQTATSLGFWRGRGGGGSGGAGGGGAGVVYLTFDDGPSGYTDAVLDVLDRHGAEATFFVIGNQVDGRASALASIVERGNAIGNHTWSHADLSSLSSDGVRQQISRTNSAIAAVTGDAPGCVRPPYGAVSDRIRSMLGDLGMTAVMWSIDTNDWRDSAGVGSISGQLDKARDGSVILMHDGGGDQSATVEAVDRWLSANAGRFDFRTLPSC